MADASAVLAKIKDEDIKFVDLRFTDPRGKVQHVTMDVSEVDEDMFNDGVAFINRWLERYLSIRYDTNA